MNIIIYALNAHSNLVFRSFLPHFEVFRFIYEMAEIILYSPLLSGVTFFIAEATPIFF